MLKYLLFSPPHYFIIYDISHFVQVSQLARSIGLISRYDSLSILEVRFADKLIIYNDHVRINKSLYHIHRSSSTLNLTPSNLSQLDPHLFVLKTQAGDIVSNVASYSDRISLNRYYGHRILNAPLIIKKSSREFTLYTTGKLVVHNLEASQVLGSGELVNNVKSVSCGKDGLMVVLYSNKTFVVVHRETKRMSNGEVKKVMTISKHDIPDLLHACALVDRVVGVMKSGRLFVLEPPEHKEMVDTEVCHEEDIVQFGSIGPRSNKLGVVDKSGLSVYKLKNGLLKPVASAVGVKYISNVDSVDT